MKWAVVALGRVVKRARHTRLNLVLDGQDTARARHGSRWVRKGTDTARFLMGMEGHGARHDKY